MIRAGELNDVLVQTLPELSTDWKTYTARKHRDREFQQSFFGYSFVPTLQVALDQHVEDFCRRAFALIERLLADGDPEVQAIVRDEFFEYGPACEKWMKRAGTYLGPLARKVLSSNSQTQP